ncbi:TPA: hypothetical protein ACYLN4_008346 [Burkholderia lata]
MKFRVHALCAVGLVFSLAGSLAFAADSSCVVGIHAESVDSSKVARTWACSGDASGTSKAVCVQYRDEPTKTHIIRMDQGEDVGAHVKAITDGMARCEH